MTVFGINVLTFLVIAPAVAGAIVMVVPQFTEGRARDFIARWLALAFSIVIGTVAVVVFFGYNREVSGFQQIVKVDWFPLLGASWHLGIDGISATLVLLTGILTPLSILVSFEHDDRVAAHMALILLFETGLLGVFLALDLMIFFLFWELSLVPMYFLINQWGGPDRKYASTKFMIYSLGGSLGFLLGVQLVGFAAGTFDIPELLRIWTSLEGETFLGADIGTVKALTFVAFFVAFAIKVPVWPFHTWLPDAHGEAPTAGSMLLAGAMLKLGAYGFLRLVIPLFPEVWVADINVFGLMTTNPAGIFAFLAMLGIVMGAFAAFGQWDIKRLVAYSSVNHMGFVVMGLAVTALAYGKQHAGLDGVDAQDAIIATNGAVLQMFNHGLSSAGMFLLAGGIYHKTHTRDMREYGGFWVKAPIYGGIFIFTSMASLGLPGLNGFVGEFLVVRGSWPVFTWLTLISMLGLLFTGGYILKGIKATLHGPFNMKWRDYNLEIEMRELVAIAPLMVLMLVTGVAPNWILPVINNSVTLILGG
ncbi:MAG: NADH-quinone oxidoreductase subunit M [Chloroflexi bacterium]|nr:MAG: hypothetical protein CUN54_03510 [Phototrophicales bacterium]RMF79428.1 MAG: NADH-quinone oxidoreductase subunit M [Chloroflexota bacterium]